MSEFKKGKKGVDLEKVVDGMGNEREIEVPAPGGFSLRPEGEPEPTCEHGTPYYVRCKTCFPQGEKKTGASPSTFLPGATLPAPEHKHDPVNHPKHYTQHPSGIECIQVTRHMSFNLGNAIKYLWRADLKNGIEDLKKAAWYIQDEIKKRGG